MKANSSRNRISHCADDHNWTTAGVLGVLLSCLSAGAGTISVVNLPATGTDAAAGITTNKHYVCAFNFGNWNTTVYTLNDGVPFTHADPGNQVTNQATFTDTTYGGRSC